MTIRVSKIAKADGSKELATDYVINGSAKAWINFDGLGKVVRDSFNVASATDNGTGNYSVNFSNNMVNLNYCATAGANDDPNVADINTRYIHHYPQSASEVRVQGFATNANLADDLAFIFTAIHGDIA